MKCIEAAITARKSGQRLVLPPPLWELEDVSTSSAIASISAEPVPTRRLLGAPPDNSLTYASSAQPQTRLPSSAYPDFDDSMEDDDNAIEDDFDYGHANTVLGIILRPPVHPRSYGVCNDATVYTYVGKVKKI